MPDIYASEIGKLCSHFLFLLKGTYAGKIYIFKELAPRSGTYELRGQGKKEKSKKRLTNPRQTNTSHGPTKTIAKTDIRPLNINLLPRFSL